ncbi:UNVERIFIED_CONTAM: hypothetical protein GTU68_063008, partial [Idotea baltica]|nr:hypothetical protein [Idotea baltica]
QFHKILITGTAGFIGFHAVKRFIEEGYEVVGVDSINDYYNPQLKLDRLAESTKYPRYRFLRAKLENKKEVQELFRTEQFDQVIHLAAQPGVRYSLQNPDAYIESNIVAFMNILEACRYNSVKHLVFASSSSVYGLNRKMPLSTGANVDHPVSLYAATKKSNELMAHTYSHLFNVPTTGLRFFTVYGPWGRPDMATQLFASAIDAGKPIKIFNEGKLSRDFTYVADIVEGIFLVSQKPPSDRIYNIGNSAPVQLMDFIEGMERAIGKEAEKEFLPMQPGDVEHTFADVTPLQEEFGYAPKTGIDEGLKQFIQWHRSYSQK